MAAGMTKYKLLITVTLLTMVIMAPAQAQSGETLFLDRYSGQANVIRF